jgi:hypothetical protein
LYQVIAYSRDIYFDYNFPTRLLLVGYDYKISFSYLISGAEANDFTVRPVMENGMIEILDEEKNYWVNQNDFRFNFPKLRSEMKVRIVGFAGRKSEICFEIQHMKSTRIYETPCRAYWSRVLMGKYLALINDKILKWTEQKN